MTIEDASCTWPPGHTALAGPVGSRGSSRWPSSPAPPAAPITGDLWAAVARRCPRNVTVVSAVAGDAVHVITAATFGVVSSAPPMVMVTVAARGRTRNLIEAGGVFAVSLLSAAQEPVARRYARPGRPAGWAYLPPTQWWTAPGSGAPLLRGAPAWLDCHLHRIVDLADRALVVGSVQHAGTGPGAAPLVRFDGTYHPLHAAPAARDRRFPEGGDET